MTPFLDTRDYNHGVSQQEFHYRRCPNKGFGLDELLVTTRDAGSLGWNSFGWGFSLANFAGLAALKRPLRMLGRIPALMFSPVEGREGKGSAYTAVFRKPVATR